MNDRDDDDNDNDEEMKTDERADNGSGTETGATNADDGAVIALVAIRLLGDTGWNE